MYLNDRGIQGRAQIDRCSLLWSVLHYVQNHPYIIVSNRTSTIMPVANSSCIDEPSVDKCEPILRLSTLHANLLSVVGSKSF
jgi:hypothetical protein